jgi:hypothetical protein
MSEEVFNNEVHSGPTKNDFHIRVDDSRGIAFEATQGMTREEAQRKNEQAVDDLFKQEEIGSVFEKGQKLEEKTLSNERNDVKSTSNNGIDSKGLESIRQESSAQDKTIQHSSVGSNFGL